MKRVFVDTNVFLRFLTEDDEGHHARAARFFRQAENAELSLVTGPPVLFEIAWTLKSAYRLSNERILHFLEAITAVPSLTLLDSETVFAAISLARRTDRTFADAYIAVSAAACSDALATFNTEDFTALAATMHDL